MTEKTKQNTEIYKFDWYANPMFEEWIWRNVVTIYCKFALIRVSIFNWVGGINKKEKKTKNFPCRVRLGYVQENCRTSMVLTFWI